MLAPDDSKNLKICWWNVNRRLVDIVKNISPISDTPDILFVTETSVPYGALPNIKKYTKYADKNVIKCHYGGVTVYVRNELASHVFGIHFKSCFISFQLDFIPSFVFIGCYIQPENSKYFNPGMFSDLSILLMDLYERKMIPILGGDLNCRYGDLNSILPEYNLVYEKNVDLETNKHGRSFGNDMCRHGHLKIRPNMSPTRCL